MLYLPPLNADAVSMKSMSSTTTSLRRLREFRIKIHVATDSRVLDVEFTYNLESDTPAGIVKEMRKELKLRNRE